MIADVIDHLPLWRSSSELQRSHGALAQARARYHDACRRRGTRAQCAAYPAPALRDAMTAQLRMELGR